MNHARNVKWVGKAVAGFPTIVGLLLGTYFTFVPHLENDPDSSAVLVTTSGIDCVLGNHVATSCLALRRGLALLVVSLLVGYIIYRGAAKYLAAVAALFGGTGLVLLLFNRATTVFFASAVLFAIGALLMRPELVTERLQDSLDGRSETE